MARMDFNAPQVQLEMMAQTAQQTGTVDRQYLAETLRWGASGDGLTLRPEVLTMLAAIVEGNGPRHDAKAKDRDLRNLQICVEYSEYRENGMSATEARERLVERYGIQEDRINQILSGKSRRRTKKQD